MTLVFYIPYYQTRSNGISLLWEIALKLSKLRKYQVYIYEKPSKLQTNFPEKFRSLVINQEIFSFIKDPIVIYPDTESKNPLNVEKVVRYLLAKPLTFGNSLTPNSREYVATYSELVMNKNILDQYYFLSNELDLQKYIDIEHKKNLVSIYYGKCRVGEKLKNFRQLIRKFDDVEIITRNEPQKQKDLFKILSKSKLLISFDSFSHITLVANILGTPVIFVDPIFYRASKKFNQKIFGNYTENDITQISEITSFNNMKKISRLTISEIKKIKNNEAKVLNRFACSIEKHFEKINNTQYLNANLKRLNIANKRFKVFFEKQWNKRQLFHVTNRQRLLIYHLLSFKIFNFLFRKLFPFIKTIKQILRVNSKKNLQDEQVNRNIISGLNMNTSRYNKIILSILWLI